MQTFTHSPTLYAVCATGLCLYLYLCSKYVWLFSFSFFFSFCLPLSTNRTVPGKFCSSIHFASRYATVHPAVPPPMITVEKAFIPSTSKTGKARLRLGPEECDSSSHLGSCFRSCSHTCISFVNNINEERATPASPQKRMSLLACACVWWVCVLCVNEEEVLETPLE